jgi:hypothetical protein
LAHSHGCVVYRWRLAVRYAHPREILPREVRHLVPGEVHDQADAKRIVIRGPLRGHHDRSCGWSTPGRLIGRPGLAAPERVVVVLVIIN